VIESHPHRALADPGAKLFVDLLVMAPPSQELEPPANPARFTCDNCDFRWSFLLWTLICPSTQFTFGTARFRGKCSWLANFS